MDCDDCQYLKKLNWEQFHEGGENPWRPSCWWEEKAKLCTFILSGNGKGFRMPFCAKIRKENDDPYLYEGFVKIYGKHAICGNFKGKEKK